MLSSEENIKIKVTLNNLKTKERRIRTLGNQRSSYMKKDVSANTRKVVSIGGLFNEFDLTVFLIFVWIRKLGVGGGGWVVGKGCVEEVNVVLALEPRLDKSPLPSTLPYALTGY